ncbi:MAG: acetyltransferase [Bryobacteraceae bacterium]|nr:acetyltransferase [Bryobacteraceae bacterium]
MSKPLLILGARKFALEVADVASEIPGFTLAGFVENTDPARCIEKLEGLPVHWVDDLAGLAATHLAVCAFGSTARRGFIEQALAHGMRFATLIHPAARVSAKSRVGEGSVIWPGVVVGAYAAIGRHVLVNRGALIGHHTELDDGITVGPGANIAGACHIGAGSYMGMGSVIVDYVRTGEGVVVAAGAVVTRDIADHVMVAGSPAMVVKTGVDGL